MHARMVTTKERKYGDFARRENSPVPGVELYDSNDSKCDHSQALFYDMHINSVGLDSLQST